MFFFFSKILHFLVSPVTWIAGLFLFAVLSKNEIRKKRSLITGTILFFFFSSAFVFDEVMRAWEIPAVPYSELDSSYEAAIVLSGMISKDDQLDRLQFHRGADRLLQCVELYKKGIVKKIIVTGGSGDLNYPDHKESYYSQRFLRTLGIPDSVVIIEPESKNTYENALFTTPILEKNFPSGTKFLLITSAYHMRRGMACFKNEGINVQAYSADRYSGPRKFGFQHIFMPDADIFWQWDVLFHEMIGYVVYKGKGYI